MKIFSKLSFVTLLVLAALGGIALDRLLLSTPPDTVAATPVASAPSAATPATVAAPAARPAAPAATSARPATPAAAPEDENASFYHVVQRDESIYSIAETYLVSQVKIRRLNRLEDSSNLQVGQRLKLPPFTLMKLSAAQWKDRFTVRAKFNEYCVDTYKALPFVTCEPKAEFSITKTSHSDGYDRDSDDDYHSHTSAEDLDLVGDFKPGTTYTFTFRKGLPTKNGPALAADVQRTVVIPNRKPALGFAVQGRYLVPGGDLLLPIKAVGVRKLHTSVAKVPAHNIVQLAARDSGLYRHFYSSGSPENDSTFDIALEPKERTNVFKVDANQVVKSQLDLRDFITPANAAAAESARDVKGVFLVKIADISDGKTEAQRSWSDRRPRDKFRLVCISDIGLSAQHCGESLLVWATSLKTGAPLPNAKLRLYKLNNTVAAEGTTDAAGLLTLPCPKDTAREGGATSPFLLVATTADAATGNVTDSTFLPLTNSHTIREAKTPDRAFLASGASEAFVFSDRGIYRHADPIFAQAILRDDKGRAPAPFPLSLDIIKPDGKLFKTLPLMPDATGAATPAAPIILGEDQPSGTWTLRISPPDSEADLGSRSIRVESIVPPQVRVAVRDLAPTAAHDASGVSFTIFSEHLFGRPASGLNATANVVFTETPFTPKGWTKYTFGNVAHKAATQTVKLPVRALDTAGKAQFTATPPKALSPSHAVRVTVGSTVVENGGRQVSAWSNTWVHRAAFYPGVRVADGAVAMPNLPFAFSLAAVTPNGTRHAASAAARVTIHSISHVSNFIESRGNYEWRTERVRTPLQTFDVTLQPGADTPFAFTPPAAGAYELEISVNDSGAATVLPFFAGDNASRMLAQQAGGRGDALDIAFDKNSYVPGDTVRGTINAPVSGTALITIRGAKSTTALVRPVGADGATFEFPVGEDAFPGLDVTVTLVRPVVFESEWRGHRFYGSKTLVVRRPNARLDVTTESAVTITRSGSTVDVAVRALTPDGKPATGALATVLLTDEAIHLLTKESLPVPADFFEAARQVFFRSYDMFNRLVPLVKKENVLGTDAAPGGGMAGSLLGRINPVKSRRFQPLSRWSADVPVAADGTARAHFDLPEFAGEVRVTAVVRNRESTGSAKQQVKIKPRIVAKADGPRFLAPGDTAQVSLAVYNESGAPCEVVTAARIKNGSGKFDTVRLPLAVGASGNATLSVTAPEAIGHTTVAFDVSGAGEEHTAEIEFPVRPAAPWETSYLCTPIAAGKTATFATPAALNPALARQSFHVTPNPGVELLPALKYVTHYPYGCVEQTTSSVFPLIAAYGEAGDLFAADPEFSRASKENLEAAIQRLELMQRHDGFSYWPSSHWIEPQYSLYAAHFVIEATQTGAVSADTLRAETLDILEKIQREKKAPEKAYASHILAIAGKADRNTMLALYDSRKNLGAESLCHLSRAFALGGDNTRARALLDQVASGKGGKSTPQSVTELTFAVLAQLEADPQSPRVTEWLAHLRLRITGDFHWGTTWDNAHALLAFTAYSRRNGGLATTATFTCHDSETGKTKSLVGSKGHVFDAAGASAVTIENKGTAPCYVFQSVRSVPLAKATEPVSNGVTVERSFYDMDGKVLDLNTLKQGDSIVVRLGLKFPSHDAITKQMVIEDLLPACFEVDSGAFLKNKDLAWLPPLDTEWVLHREVRDDRVLLFSATPREANYIYYKAQVVSQGRYALPPVSAEAMYNPAIKSRTTAGVIEVK